jgi:glycosyltransferase involved in cell wall biosynthesis
VKVALITPSYPPAHGGVADAVGRLSHELVRLGHRVMVISAETPQPAAPSTSDDEAGYGRVRVVRLPRLVRDRWVLGRSVLSPSAIRDAVREHDADIVHLHGLGNLGSDLAVRALGPIPYVVTGHGPGWSHDPNRGRLLRLAWASYFWTMGHRTVVGARGVIALTQDEVPYWVRWGVSPARIHTIGWGIPEDCRGPRDPDRFRRAHDLEHRILLFVGSSHPAKGSQRLVAVLPRVIARHGPVHAVFVGEDLGFYEALRREAAAMGCAQYVHLLGFVSREELLDAYAACDILVLPSDYEAFGLAVVEAMAFGKPVVASRVGSLPWIVRDEATGILVHKDDLVGLEAALLRLLGDEPLRRRMGHAAREDSEQYRWPEVAARHTAVYRAAIDDR